MIKLLCNGRKNPIGIDKNHVILTLNSDFELKDAVITIFKQNFSSTFKAVVDKSGYCGCHICAERLQPGVKYFWFVTYDGDGRQRSETAFFETMPEFKRAEWIQPHFYDGSVLRFSHSFIYDSGGEIRLYICGLGYFDAVLNGKRIDDTYFKPLMTDYCERDSTKNALLKPQDGHSIFINTYDVTDYLICGKNVLTVDVAPGYFCNTDKIEDEPFVSFGEPKLFFEMHRLTERGSEVITASSTECTVSHTGCFSSLYKGDFVDFRKDTYNFVTTEVSQSPTGDFTSPDVPEDRIIEEIVPISSRTVKDGVLYDFGVNHTGVLSFTALGGRGDEIRIRFAEVLKNGEPNYETGAWEYENHTHNTISRIDQDARYILSGDTDIIRPLFHWNCYRYAVVSAPCGVVITDIKSLFISSDIKQDGDFSCSEPVLNRLHDLFLQTVRCNMHSGLLTDCPHREKLPYTGDGRLVMKPVLYVLDSVWFYRKWLRDILDAQQNDGAVPYSAPYLGGGGGYAWANAICAVPDLLYGYTGDKAIIAEAYPHIKRYLGYYESKRDEDYIIRCNSNKWMLGDWLAPEIVRSDVYYISTVCYLQAVKAAIRFSEIVCNSETPRFEKLRDTISAAINRTFFNPETLQYGNGVQGENVLALSVGIVPDEYIDDMQDKVRRHYTEETQYHIDTGIVLTPVVINYLTQYGMEDIALKLMLQQSAPSYAAMMQDETTLPEHWSKKWPDYAIDAAGKQIVKGGGELSHCHPMYGSTVAWLYESVAGLDLTDFGSCIVKIKPAFLDKISFAQACKETTYGKAMISWRNSENKLLVNAVIPAGCTAHCRFRCKYSRLTILQNNTTVECGADGYFSFTLSDGDWTFRLINEKGDM